MTGLALRSTAFADHGEIPRRFSRADGNVSPPLEWSGVPDTAEELLLLCEDPDAPRGPFLHWLVTGIDPTVTAAPEGQPPPGGREWPNDFGTPGWGGPHPPVGDRPHRYRFHLYALSGPPRLPARPRARDVERAVEGLVLASGVLEGRYGR